ncbi:prenylated Rab acceptor protein 1-like [Tubulanus polymorphus]|uniref:prenylated Rab acceptor protein 1-like n=1 Tax=Tubulanus polymorphus TaxID=672921 RepID=UPI003DA5A895
MGDTELTGNLDVLRTDDVVPKKGIMGSINLTNIQAREWFQKTREKVQPWSVFLSTKKFKLPKTMAPLGPRIVKNVEKFQGNYVFVFLVLVIFCILTSPLLLVAIAASLGACYIISIKNKEQKLKIMGHELTLVQQYAAVGVTSIPLFWLVGAGTAVFWVIGASFFTIMLHASMYTAEEDDAFEELQMEEV